MDNACSSSDNSVSQPVQSEKKIDVTNESESDLFLSQHLQETEQINGEFTQSVTNNGSCPKTESYTPVSQNSLNEENALANFNHSVRNIDSRCVMEEAGCKLERPGPASEENEDKNDQKLFDGACADTVNKFKEVSADDKLVELFKEMCLQSKCMQRVEREMCLQSERMQRVETEVQRLSVAVDILNKTKKEPPKKIKVEPKKTDMLTIGALNVNSLKARTKPGEAYNNFCSLINKYDIFCCSETKLVAEGVTDIISIKGYQLINQARKELMVRASGGIGCFIKRSLLKFVSIVDTESEYVMWLKISKSLCHSKEDIMIGNIYIAPETSDYYFSEDELDRLEEEISSTCKDNNYVLLTGDMNARTAACNYLEKSTIDKCKLADHPDVLDISESRTSQDLERNNIGEWLIETCTANKLYILNGRFGEDKDIGKFTFKETSVIDYTVCTAAVLKLLEDFEIIKDVSFGGHSLVKTVLKCRKT